MTYSMLIVLKIDLNYKYKYFKYYNNNIYLNITIDYKSINVITY